VEGDVGAGDRVETIHAIREYLQLVRTRDGWRIVNPLWQRT
jgi:hypothetical protein